MFNISQDWKRLRIPHRKSKCWCHVVKVTVGDADVSIHLDDNDYPPAEVVHDAFQDALMENTLCLASR